MTSSSVTQTFPLFSTLEQKWSEQHQPWKTTPLTDTQKQYICDQLKCMDDMGCELVYAVIRFYQLHYEEGNIMELPFQLKKQKTGGIYKLDLNDLPLKLQRMILIFSEMHNHSNNSNDSPLPPPSFQDTIQSNL
jgi:hypothetical protein